MASMSPQDIRDFVRTHLDVDSEELPDIVLDRFMVDGFNKIVGYFDDRPVFYEVEYTFTTADGTQVYPLDTTTGLDLPTPLQYVDDVRGDNWSLSPVQHRRAREKYRQFAPTDGKPLEFSLFARNLYLWPIPDQAQSLTVTGIRQPSDWLAANTPPDVPEEFHTLIAFHALARGYAQQDDPEMAAVYSQTFVDDLHNLAKRWKGGTDAQPFVMNGGRRRDLYRTERSAGLIGTPVFDWE